MSERQIYQSGQVVDRRFRVVDLIGKGGMSEVYRVETLKDGAERALKIVLPDLLGSKKAITRFEREMEWTRRIDHPNVVDIQEFLRLRVDGVEVPALVMELLDGESLVDHLERHGVMTAAEAKPIVCQMAAAIDAAHAAGIVHRDLKPANVLLVPDGQGGHRVVLTDFGVARESKGSDLRDSSQALTASNVILGTPEYLAPEQLELEEAIPSSDLYALGLVFYQMVTGKLPFEGETPLEAVFQRVQRPAPTPRLLVPDLDADCERVILRCLEREPKDRYPTGGDLIRDLDGSDSGYLEGLPPRRSARRLELWVTVAVAVLLVLSAAALVWYYAAQ